MVKYGVIARNIHRKLVPTYRIVPAEGESQVKIVFNPIEETPVQDRCTSSRYFSTK